MRVGAFVRRLPFGLNGVFHMEKMVDFSGTRALANPDLVMACSIVIYPTLDGLQRMAQAVVP